MEAFYFTQCFTLFIARRLTSVSQVKAENKSRLFPHQYSQRPWFSEEFQNADRSGFSQQNGGCCAEARIGSVSNYGKYALHLPA
jgi:hypothetical protein